MYSVTVKACIIYSYLLYKSTFSFIKKKMDCWIACAGGRGATLNPPLDCNDERFFVNMTPLNSFFFSFFAG
jgi:hypothetical protein